MKNNYLIVITALMALGACTTAPNAASEISASVQNSPSPSSKLFDCAIIESTSSPEEIRNSQIETNFLNPSSPDNFEIELGEDTIQISKAGTYLISGEGSGEILVNSTGNGHVKLILNNIKMTSESQNAIYIEAAASFEINLPKSTTNFISSGSNSATDDTRPNALIFSRVDLNISGQGTLDLNSSIADSITSKDGIFISDSHIQIKSADEGIQANDYVKISNGKLDVDSKGDAIRVNKVGDSKYGWIEILGGVFNLKTSKDAIQAETNIIISDSILKIDAQDDGIVTYCHVWLNADIEMNVNDDGIRSNRSITFADGVLNITNSYEGIEARNILILGGLTRIRARNDGINGVRNRNIYDEIDNEVSFTQLNGVIKIVTEGEDDGDGIDVEGNVVSSGGEMTIQSTVDKKNDPFDIVGNLEISGATWIAVSTWQSRMEANFADAMESGQPNVWFYSTEGEPAGVYKLIDAQGNTIATIEALQDWGGIWISSPEINSGETYILSYKSVDVHENFSGAEESSQTESTSLVSKS